MKVKVSRVIMFQVVFLMVVMLMLFDAVDLLPDSLESGIDLLAWTQAPAMTAAIIFAIWICWRDARVRKNAGQTIKTNECTVNQG